MPVKIRRPKLLSMNHLALRVQNLEKCQQFYTKILGMKIEWHPDVDNIYLTSGTDNLALHRAPKSFNPSNCQKLDHLGFSLSKPDDVDRWYEFMREQKVIIKTLPRTHRDGARSFYCLDPEDNAIQMIYHPPLANLLGS